MQKYSVNQQLKIPMSLHSLHLYHAEVEKLVRFGGTAKETAIRSAFFNLLNDYARQQGLMMVSELIPVK